MIRFVDSNKHIREEFLGFITVERITGEVLGAALLSWLEIHNLDVSLCRGQGYDGASNMSSSVRGVQARIREASPLALYTHCQSHQLNLCIVNTCSLPKIRNASGVISEIAKFFNNSPKRQHFFEHVIESNTPTQMKTKLKDLCRTHWVQRINAYTVFYDLYSSIIKTVEHISTCNCSEYGNWSWDTKTVTKARGFLFQLKSFEFLLAFNITMRLLSTLRSLTVKLQKTSNDILAAYELVSEVQMDLELLKINCEEEFHLWLDDVKILADKLDIAVAVPRINARQVHRDNIPADSPEEYYRRNLMIPFLDHITTELENRFGPIHQTKVKLLGLVPALATSYPLASINEVGDLYKADLPSPYLLSTEFSRWKSRFSSTPHVGNRPDNLQKTLQVCDEDDFPNISVLLAIAYTLPVTTCETKRANSQLKLLKTYLRSTMTEERLTSLAMIKIHRDRVANLDFDKLVVDFANKHPRRMALPCVFAD